MVAICNDDLAVVSIPQQKERGNRVARENFCSILLHVRIADSQQGQPRSSENILCLELRHRRSPELLHKTSGDPLLVDQTQIRLCCRIVMLFRFSQPLDFSVFFHRLYQPNRYLPRYSLTPAAIRLPLADGTPLPSSHQWPEALFCVWRSANHHPISGSVEHEISRISCPRIILRGAGTILPQVVSQIRPDHFVGCPGMAPKSFQREAPVTGFLPACAAKGAILSELISLSATVLCDAPASKNGTFTDWRPRQSSKADEARCQHCKCRSRKHFALTACGSKLRMESARPRHLPPLRGAASQARHSSVRRLR